MISPEYKTPMRIALKVAAAAIVAASFVALIVSSRERDSEAQGGKGKRNPRLYAIWQVRVVRSFLYAAIWLFVLTHFAYLLSDGPSQILGSGLKAMSDYATFGMPCIAAMLAGLGFVEGKHGTTLINDLSGRAFTWSIAMLLLSYCAYLWSHPSLGVISFAGLYDLVVCVASMLIIGAPQARDPAVVGRWAAFKVRIHRGVRLGFGMFIILVALFALVYSHILTT